VVVEQLVLRCLLLVVEVLLVVVLYKLIECVVERGAQVCRGLGGGA
jgi:hypothetical protein